jgi:hypothetical protein
LQSLLIIAECFKYYDIAILQYSDIYQYSNIWWNLTHTFQGIFGCFSTIETDRNWMMIPNGFRTRVETSNWIGWYGPEY